MEFILKWGIFQDINTRWTRPEKGHLRGKITEEELDKVIATYVKGILSPGPRWYYVRAVTGHHEYGTQNHPALDK